MEPTVLIAIGGNALMRATEAATEGAERTHVIDACRVIADVVSSGWRVVITHGNGPQVGAALLRSERAAAEAYPLPLDLCVASTQGEVGYLLQQGLDAEFASRGLQRRIGTVVTQVVVDENDRAFAGPAKPIGPFYTKDKAAAFEAQGWTMVEQPAYGWRRVVPSPDPLEIVEEPVIRALLDANAVVIALGGGGIPVVRNGHRLSGVDAVVDKDLASALLATRLQVDRLILATDVDRVYLDFGTPAARAIHESTADDLRRHAAAGQFAPGSMGPKVEAALRFVDRMGRVATICSQGELSAALSGHAGTRICPPRADRPELEDCARTGVTS